MLSSASCFCVLMFVFICFLFFRLDWPQLLDHPFWTQVLKEEEGVEEGEEELEGNNGYRRVGSANSRCVDILLFLLILQALHHSTDILLQPFYCIQIYLVKE